MLCQVHVFPYQRYDGNRHRNTSVTILLSMFPNSLQLLFKNNDLSTQIQPKEKSNIKVRENLAQSHNSRKKCVAQTAKISLFWKAFESNLLSVLRCNSNTCNPRYCHRININKLMKRRKKA